VLPPNNIEAMMLKAPLVLLAAVVPLVVTVRDEELALPT
jgi:hypothetical protein